MIDPLLLTTTRVCSFHGERALANASGFFYREGSALFLVTSRHVLIDEASHHHPDRIEIELHTDAANLTRSAGFSIPLYRDGLSLWRQAEDGGGTVDVAAIELDQAALPETLFHRAFCARNLLDDPAAVAIGSPLLVVGFPLGFHDGLHRLPVVRHAVNASSFALRFQGKGYFLTDSRTHSGTSGGAVVMRASDAQPEELPWKLLGVHSSRLDMISREIDVDEALGLNCVWFADILRTLTAPCSTSGPAPDQE